VLVRSSDAPATPASPGFSSDQLWGLSLGEVQEERRGFASRWDRPRNDPSTVGQAGRILGSSEVTAAIALVLLCALGIQALTVIELGHLLALHIVMGAGIGALVATKLASVGRRALAWHRGEGWVSDRPALAARVLGAGLVAATVAVLLTGAAILVVGHADVLGAREAHIAAFVAWAVLLVAHLVRNAWRALRVAARSTGLAKGRRSPEPLGERASWWRGVAVAGVSLAAGITFGAVVVSQFAPRVAALQSHLANVHLPI